MKTADFHGFPSTELSRHFTWAALILTLLILPGCQALDSRRIQPEMVSNGTDASPPLYGNVRGVIIDFESGAPLSGAQIYLADLTVRRYPSKIEGAVPSDDGWIVIPPIGDAIRKGRSKMDGTFIVNKIPTADPPKTYTIIIVTPEKDTLLIENATIYPGASLSLGIECRVPDDGNAHVVSTDEASAYVVPTYSPEKP